MALAHPKKNGATLFGVDPKIKVHCEWAAWANGTAVRELDYHDTFLAADYSHPGDNIPAILAVAQQKKIDGINLIKGILTGYEVQVNLVKGICLHEHKIDHIAHLGPSVAAGIGTLLKLKDIIYQSVQQLFTQLSLQDSLEKEKFQVGKLYFHMRKGNSGSRCQGEGALVLFEEDSVIAFMLSGPDKEHTVPLPNINQEKELF